MGGHKPRKLIGAHRVWLLERTKTDFTLRGLRAELAERGIKVDYRTVWSFAHTEGLSFKKACFPPNSFAQRSPVGASNGRNIRGGLIPNVSSSLMKRG
jgi:putative transposase